MRRGGGWFLVSLGLMGLLLAWYGPAPGVAPTAIRFSHTFHLGEDVGAECTSCHGAEASESSVDRLLPAMEVCAECHDVEDEDLCEVCHPDLDNVGEIDIPVREILFSHQAHLQYRGVECGTCHGGMERVSEPGESHLPEMVTCVTCHEDEGGPDACGACHTDVTGLRPESHIHDWVHDHGRQVRAEDPSCAQCHNQGQCQECHDDAGLSVALPSLGSRATFAPLSEGEAGTVLKAVHGLNYRFTHSLDAGGKERECTTCHERATFCAECHNPDSAPAYFRPAWHGGVDWGAIAGAVGTGGGRHASLARKDMERCAACHDIEGDDPTCVLCHADRTPGRGNDPKTHGSRFKSQVGDGEFHDDPNSMCFNCHTFKGPAGGPGFCGYCHGSR